jgi:hypothetical protein
MKINNKITFVIIEIVIEKGLDIKILLPLRRRGPIKPVFSLKTLPRIVEFNLYKEPKIGFTSCSGE